MLQSLYNDDFSEVLLSTDTMSLDDNTLGGAFIDPQLAVVDPIGNAHGITATYTLTAAQWATISETAGTKNWLVRAEDPSHVGGTLITTPTFFSGAHSFEVNSIDLELTSFHSDGYDLVVEYQVSGPAGSTAAPFNVEVFVSDDGSTQGTNIATFRVEDSTLLTTTAAGEPHQVKLRVDDKLTQLQYNLDHYLLVAIDSGNEQSNIEENENNNEGVFEGGVFVSRSASGAPNVVHVHGSANLDPIEPNDNVADTIELRGTDPDPNHNVFEVALNEGEPGAATVKNYGQAATHTISVRVYGHGGNDTISIDESFPTFVASNARIFAGAGDDEINNAGIIGTVSGGMGDDTFRFVSDIGHTTIVESADADTDTLDFSQYSDGIVLDLAFTSTQHMTGSSELSLTLDNASGIENVVGSSGTNIISGNDRPNFLQGGGDDDSFFGGAAGDTLEGNGGADLLDGGTGNDILDAGPGNLVTGDRDILRGDAGDDILIGGNSTDLLEGGSGDDTIFGGFGDDEIDGGTGSDTLYDADGLNKVSYTPDAEDDTFAGNLGSGSFVGDSLVGTWKTEIGGAALFDELEVNGLINLDNATLDVDLLGYVPVAGDSFSILTATAGLSGEFETVDFGDAVLADGLAWQVVYDRTTADGDGLEAVLEVLPPVEVEVDAVAIEAALSSYSPGTDFDFTDQDTNSIAAVVDNGATLQIDGDGWKKIALPYTVTARKDVNAETCTLSLCV